MTESDVMNYERDTVYAYDSKRKVRQWSVWSEGDTVFVEHGLVDGKQVLQTTKCKAKNVGKSNATTPESQAYMEAGYKLRHQVEREDYHHDVDKSGKQLRCMLARDYTKVPHQVKWAPTSYSVQPKMDGLRLTYGTRYHDGIKPELLTRKGEVYVVNHISMVGNALLDIIEEDTGTRPRALDGELYVHGMPLNEINKRAKKDMGCETERLQYYLFDLVYENDLTFIERYSILEDAIKRYSEQEPELSKWLELVPNHVIDSEEDMIELHKMYAGEGYEGVIIRQNDATYVMAKKPPCMFKYKEFMDEEFMIIDVWEDKNGNAMFTCTTNDKQTFDCTPKRTHVERKEMLSNSADYMGKWLTVKFQQYTPFGIPEFPVGLGIRECDDKGEPLV